MTDRNPSTGFVCPRCQGQLETWARKRLQVEFCDACSALFLDRGEMFALFRSEGYNCPPEAHLRFDFSPGMDGALECPKCAKDTLTPGTLQGLDVWHCTPCNGFLVDRDLLLGEALARETPLHLKGFRRVGAGAGGDEPVPANLIVRTLQRLSLWSRQAQ
jgi:Zn-finger nucleic acid-binding protein